MYKYYKYGDVFFLYIIILNFNGRIDGVEERGNKYTVYVEYTDYFGHKEKVCCELKPRE